MALKLKFEIADFCDDGKTTTTTSTIFICAQKLDSIDLNAKERKIYKGNEYSHLEIAKLLELSGWAKQK